MYVCSTCIILVIDALALRHWPPKCAVVYSSSTTIDTCTCISCKKCGIQYIGETSQKLRNGMNNHRNRLRNLTNLYLYQHFNSDGHSEEDLSIMPIEEITTSDKGTCAKRLEREDYWCRELCTFYPYGLNDNVRKVGNISKCKDKIVVNTLFHKQTRKFRKRQPRKRRRKIEVTNLTESLETLLDNYKSCHFCFSIRSLVLSLPRKCIHIYDYIMEYC